MHLQRARLVLLGILTCTTPALAQSGPPNDRNLDIQLYEPAPGAHSFLTVSSADVMGRGQFQLAFNVSYMSHPFSVFLVDPANGNAMTERANVVTSVVTGHLYGAVGIRDGLQLGASLPMTLNMSGDGLDPSTGLPFPGGLSVMGLGDLHLELAWRFYQKGQISVAAIPSITVPTGLSVGDQSDFLGEGFPSFRPRLAAEWSSQTGQFTVAGNLGLILREPRNLYSSEVGQQLTYAVAGAYHPTNNLDVMLELIGRKGFNGNLDESPLEADVGLRLHLGPGFTVTLGGGTGLIKGIGAPSFRVFVAVGWAPDFRDSDGDGIDNMHDKCPFEPEDKDGFQDDDGCPDPDNDGDGIPDAQDKCPNEAEDFDGFEDEDGCPDPDNDHDGIPDFKDACPNDPEDHIGPRPDDGCPASMRDGDEDGVPDNLDKCPNEAEDKDGFHDEDGCPDPDNDGDGIPDSVDKCPNEPEDMDGFEDDDGCPDPDNDHDGVPDAMDKCPNEPETINGFKDDDGCPDTGGKALVKLAGTLLTLGEPVQFDGGNLKAKSDNLMNQAALTMRAHAEVKKWRIVVAAEKQKSEEEQRRLSQARADALKAALVARGVSADRIEAIGAVSDKPTVAIVAAEKDEGAAPPPPPEEPGTIEIEP